MRVMVLATVAIFAIAFGADYVLTGLDGFDAADRAAASGSVRLD